MRLDPRTALDRRRLLVGAGGLGVFGLAGCATPLGPTPTLSPAKPSLPIYPIRATPDRLFDITVCLRPFRAAGPRLEAETIGEALVVHNYGHGGSGWSLSWGSSTLAVQMAIAASPRKVAVIGCGALGLLGDPGAGGGLRRHHLRQGLAAADPFRPRHGQLDA